MKTASLAPERSSLRSSASVRFSPGRRRPKSSTAISKASPSATCSRIRQKRSRRTSRWPAGWRRPRRRSSSHSTLLELITQDRPGLLYQVSSAMAEMGCTIEVALIDTEGQKVIDVFYLTAGGAKLDPAQQHSLRDTLMQLLWPSSAR